MTDYLEDVDCHYIVPLIRLDISAPNEISRDGVRQKTTGITAKIAIVDW